MRVMPRRLLGLCTAVAAAAIAGAAPAAASDRPIMQISDDPFTNTTSQHRTEVEPDTFAFRSTMVSAFQVGRFFNGGASDIGFSTSTDGGFHFTSGLLPGVTTFSTPAGTYDRASDASVAYDLKHHTWVISYLGIFNSSNVVDVVASRSPDGINWGMPVPVAKLNVFLDKNWTVCDDSERSPFFGNCYTEFDNASQRDLELMSTSTDGGLTWGAAQATADMVHGLGGQPQVQPSGRVVVPFEGVGAARGIRAFTSDDGGATWKASVLVSSITAHRVAGGLRTSPLPSAEMNRDGRVFVVWQDCRFEANCPANDIVLSASDDGATWSPVSRVPIDPVGSMVDHFIPGIGVNRMSGNSETHLALTYYFYPNAACTAATCQLQVAFVSSRNGGATWTQPDVLSGPMSLSWIAATSQGTMVGDYISTSILPGTRTALPAFALATAPTAPGAFHEPMFSAREEVRPGSVPTAADTVLFGPGSASGATGDGDCGQVNCGDGGDGGDGG